jgi:WhiB family transcriptional regulator, redox-sensing transcriptional regulator
MTDWALAGCTGADPEVWFRDADSATANWICSGCLIRQPCLQAALNEEKGSGQTFRHGIRGGLTGPQRYHLWKNRVRRKAEAT